MMSIKHISSIAFALVFALALTVVSTNGASAASGLPVQENRVFTGTVTEVNGHAIEMVGVGKNGQEVRPKFSITDMTQFKNGVLLLTASEEVRFEVTNEIRRGSVVTIWYSHSGVALVVKNTAPKSQADFYGPVDCSKCGGSTN